MQDFQTQRMVLKNRVRRRGIFLLPNLFTTAALFAGFYAIVQAMNVNFDYAAIAIFVAMVLDGLDGRIARLTKTASDFGIQLDSIADVVTFGVAPAILAFSWGFGASEGIGGSVARHVHQLGSVASFAFVVCGALRLARFNLQAKKPVDTSSKRYFVGLPIPAGAGMKRNTVVRV